MSEDLRGLIMKKMLLSRALLGIILSAGMGWGQQHFEPVDTTGVVSSIIIANGTINGGQFQNEDEIAVFDDTLCVGFCKVDSFPLSLTAWLKIEINNVIIPGATEGNPMVFKVWQQSTNTEMDGSAIYEMGGEFGDELTIVDPLSASSTGVSENFPGSQIPNDFDLLSNYPNPFNPITTIRYHLPVDVETLIVVYDILGQQICTLVDGYIEAGRHTARWDGRNDKGVHVGTGNYIVKIEAGDFSKSMKILLIK